jgi:hypothetical protein
MSAGSVIAAMYPQCSLEGLRNHLMVEKWPVIHPVKEKTGLI